MTMGCKDIGIRIFEFVAKTRSFWAKNSFLSLDENS